MGQRKDESRGSHDLVYETSDIVQAIRRAVKAVASGRKVHGERGKREARNAIARSAPPIADVFRGDPTQQEHRANGNPPVDPQEDRLPRIRRRSKLRGRRENIVHDQPGTAADPQQ
jgi:hypothetical protein